MQTTHTEVRARPEFFFALGMALVITFMSCGLPGCIEPAEAAGTKLTTNNASMAAPANPINLASTTCSDGTALTFMRSDASCGVTGILPVANGGTGAVAMSCAITGCLSTQDTWTAQQTFNASSNATQGIIVNGASSAGASGRGATISGGGGGSSASVAGASTGSGGDGLWAVGGASSQNSGGTAGTFQGGAASALNGFVSTAGKGLNVIGGSGLSTSGGGGNGGAAIQAQGGTGAGVGATGAEAIIAIADSNSAPTHGPVLLNPVTATPTAPTNGDIWVENVNGIWNTKVRMNGSNVTLSQPSNPGFGSPGVQNLMMPQNSSTTIWAQLGAANVSISALNAAANSFTSITTPKGYTAGVTSTFLTQAFAATAVNGNVQAVTTTGVGDGGDPSLAPAYYALFQTPDGAGGTGRRYFIGLGRNTSLCLWTFVTQTAAQAGVANCGFVGFEAEPSVTANWLFCSSDPSGTGTSVTCVDTGVALNTDWMFANFQYTAASTVTWSLGNATTLTTGTKSTNIPTNNGGGGWTGFLGAKDVTASALTNMKWIRQVWFNN